MSRTKKDSPELMLGEAWGLLANSDALLRIFRRSDHSNVADLVDGDLIVMCDAITDIQSEAMDLVDAA